MLGFVNFIDKKIKLTNCGSGDIMVLVCHLTSQYHLIKGSCEFMDGTPPPPHDKPHPVKLDGHRHCGSGDIMDLVCHVIS